MSSSIKRWNGPATIVVPKDTLDKTVAHLDAPVSPPDKNLFTHYNFTIWAKADERLKIEQNYLHDSIILF